MKKLVVLSSGLIAAAGSVAVITAGIALSQPGGDQSSLNVVGEPYQKALQELKGQGVHAYFGGSFGSVLPQAQCLVDQQKVMGRRMLLMLDCSQKAADQLAAQGPSGGPTVGSNGVTTVTPTPVVPIGGAPGAGTPMPPG